MFQFWALLRSVHSPAGLHQCLLPIIEMGSSAGHVPLVSGQLAGCGGVASSSRPSAPVVPGPGCCDELGEVRPANFHSGPIFWHDYRHLRWCSHRMLEYLVFRKCRPNFLPFLLLKQGCGNNCWASWPPWNDFIPGVALTCALKDIWLPMSDDSSLSVPLSLQ